MVIPIPGGYYLKARQPSEIDNAPPHVREIWDWLLKQTNHADTKICTRGQCYRTYRDMQEGLKWFVGYRKVTYKKHHCEMAMKWLRKAKMITTAKTTRGLLITILNYNRYQDPLNYMKATPEAAPEATMKLQPTSAINNNDNNDNTNNVPDTQNAKKPLPYKEIIERLNEKARHFYKTNPVAKDHKKHIKARWNDNATVQDFFNVIDYKSSEWLTNEKMVNFLRPETLFGTNFSTYLAEAEKAKSQNIGYPKQPRKKSNTELLYYGFDILVREKGNHDKFNEFCKKNNLSDDDKNLIMTKYEREK